MLARSDSDTRPQGTAQCPPSERRRGGARGLDSVARDYPTVTDNLMPVPQADCAGCTLTRLGPGPRRDETGSWAHKDQPETPAPSRDRWLNSSWTLSFGGTLRLNRPRGASLEGLSGWIRTAWRAARAQCRAGANRGCVVRTADGGDSDSDGSYKDAVPTRPPSQHEPGGTSGPPAGGRAGLRRPHRDSGPGHGRRLPEPRKADHLWGPEFMPADPGPADSDGWHNIVVVSERSAAAIIGLSRLFA